MALGDEGLSVGSDLGGDLKQGSEARPRGGGSSWERQKGWANSPGSHQGEQEHQAPVYEALLDQAQGGA